MNELKTIVLILSTGRTGTQFFQNYINGTGSHILCLHEPKPSRRFKFWSNLNLDGKDVSKRIMKHFHSTRSKILNKNKECDTYVESNNFLFGCVPALNEKYSNIKIIHIVRDPVSYTRSHMNHGFWRGHKKIFAKYTPWLEKIENRRSNDPVLILLDRWNYVNKVIEQNKKSNPYLLVKFEELFNKDRERGSNILNTIRDFIGLDPLTKEENEYWLNQPMNNSVNDRWTGKYAITNKHVDFLKNECEELMTKYGYFASNIQNCKESINGE